MWNWLRCRRRTPEPPAVLKDGEEARQLRHDAEENLSQERLVSEQVDRLVRRASPVKKDTFAEDLRRAFG